MRLSPRVLGWSLGLIAGWLLLAPSSASAQGNTGSTGSQGNSGASGNSGYEVFDPYGIQASLSFPAVQIRLSCGGSGAPCPTAP